MLQNRINYLLPYIPFMILKNQFKEIFLCIIFTIKKDQAQLNYMLKTDTWQGNWAYKLTFIE